MKMLRAFGHSIQHMSQHHATMLQDVALKCCERLASPLRWPNTVFARALANAMQRVRKDCKKINMASIQQLFHFLKASAICTIFPHN